jgi:predicted nuclease with TOPRIM domain
VIPAMIIKAVIPKVLDIILKQFKGIEKIHYLVDYMEKENDADKAIKELQKENNLLREGQEQLADELDEIKSKIK